MPAFESLIRTRVRIKYMQVVLGIALGGALGALARYGMGLCFKQALFPWATLVVNVLGCFALSYLVHVGVPPAWRLSIGTGFLGAFTTFSTYALETELLISKGSGNMAALYVLANLVLGYGAVLLGKMLAKWS